MENCGNPGEDLKGGRRTVRACSACAGNYEDPDRTAWRPVDEEEAAPEDEGSADEAQEG